MPSSSETFDTFFTNVPAATTPLSSEPTLVLQGGTTKQAPVSSVNATPNWINVKKFGAKGDGVTDDTAAINAAIATIPVTGGELYFPAGNYVTTGGFTITNETTIRGDGAADNLTPPTTAISQIECTSGTAVLFTVTALAARFRDLSLYGTAADGTITAGGAILCNSSSQYAKVDFLNLNISRFYDSVDVAVGSGWYMEACKIFNGVHYGVRVRNTINADNGDWHIHNTGIQMAAFSNAGIQYESSGGGTISDTKIQGGGLNACLNGINVAVTGASSQILISTCSIEAVSNEPIKVTGNGNWNGLTINNCFLRVTSTTASAINVSNFTDVNIGSNVLHNSSAGTQTALTITGSTNVNVAPQAHNFTSILTHTTNTNLSVVSNNVAGVIALISGNDTGSRTTQAIQFSPIPVNGGVPSVQIDNQFGLVLGGASSVIGFTNSSQSSGTVDLQFGRDQAGVLLFGDGNLANGGMRAYNVGGGTSNYERGTFDWVTAANVLTVGTQKNGSGSARVLNLSSTSYIELSAAGGVLGAGSNAQPEVTVGADWGLIIGGLQSVLAFTNNNAANAGSVDTTVGRNVAGQIGIGTAANSVGGTVQALGYVANGDPGGTASTNTLSGASSTTISTGVGVIHMSTGNPATNSGWLKCYIGTQVAWIPCWTTNAP